jgi:hypothetical protein
MSSDPGMTHYVGDDCPGGHEGDDALTDLERKVAEQRDEKRAE